MMDPGKSHERDRYEGWPAHPWADIEAMYRTAASKDSWLLPMADLVARIIRSGAGQSLHGLTSLRRLRCMMYETIYVDEPTLVITPTPDATYQLVFDHPVKSLWRKDWNATYGAAELPAAVSRFLSRVGWFPDGHPAHAALLGEA